MFKSYRCFVCDEVKPLGLKAERQLLSHYRTHLNEATFGPLAIRWFMRYHPETGTTWHHYEIYRVGMHV